MLYLLGRNLRQHPDLAENILVPDRVNFVNVVISA